MVPRLGFQRSQHHHRRRVIAAGLLRELPPVSGSLNIPLGCQRQSRVVGGFMVAIYPRQRLGKMLRRKIVLVENNLKSARRLVQSDAVRKPRYSLLVSVECNY